jgi:hypothetical protein
MLNGFLAVLILVLAGCVGSSGGDEKPYYLKITGWQANELEHGGQDEDDFQIDRVKYFKLSDIKVYIDSFKLEYKSDRKRDNWKFSETTQADGGGDCEDLANFYYLRLRELGYWPDDKLILVLLDDSNAKSDHVMVAFQTSDGVWYCVGQGYDKPFILLFKDYFLLGSYSVMAEYNLFDIWYDEFPAEGV